MAATKRLNVRWWVLVAWLVGIWAGGHALAHLSGPGSLVPAVIWTVIGALGVVLGVKVTVQAYRDLHATQRNGMSLVYVRGLIRREVVSMTQLLTMLVIGLVAVSPVSFAWARETTVAGLIYIASTITLNTAFDSTLRERMRRAEEEKG